MILKSDYKQWYDGCQGYDDSKEIVYIRKMGTPVHINVPKDFPRISYLFEGFNEQVNQFAIYFAGTYYPVAHSYRWNENNGREIFSYIGTESKKINWADQYSGRRSIFEYFAQPNTFLTELGVAYGPIFGIFQYTGKQNDPQPRVDIIQNPRLEAYGFHKVLSAPLAYNQLKLWLSNQARPERPIPVMSNDIKIQQAGFDLKHSFRNNKKA